MATLIFLSFQQEPLRNSPLIRQFASLRETKNMVQSILALSTDIG